VVGKEPVIQLKSGIVAIEGYFQFEHVDSLKNSLFSFPLVTAKLIGDVLSFFGHFTPSAPIHGM
jgi:hypothetical protein